MTIQYIEGLIKKDQKKRGVSEFDHTEGYVDYAMAAWLFDMGFNEPCDTYFHNEDDNADYPVGTPERDQWENRENNWEICGCSKFINHPYHFVVRCRYARPTYAQVLRWIEKEWGATIKFGRHSITVKNLTIKFDDQASLQETFTAKTAKPINPNTVLQRTLNAILVRLRLCGYSIPAMPNYAV